MAEAVRLARTDYVIHLGDIATDAAALSKKFPLLPLISVNGNCDFTDYSRETRIVELGGIRFFLTHGHRYGHPGAHGDALSHAVAHAHGYAVSHAYGHTHALAYAFPHAPA